MVKPETPYVSFSALAHIDNRFFVYPGFRGGAYKVIYVDGNIKGTIIRKSEKDCWLCDPNLVDNYPKLAGIPLSTNIDTALRIVSGFIRKSETFKPKEEDMSVDTLINKDALIDFAKASSDKMIKDVIAGNLNEAKSIRKELLAMTLELIELSDSLHKIYKTSVAYAVAISPRADSSILEND